MRFLLTSQLFLLIAEATAKKNVHIELMGKSLSLEQVSLLRISKFHELHMGQERVIELTTGFTAHLFLLLLFRDELHHVIEHVHQVELERYKLCLRGSFLDLRSFHLSDLLLNISQCSKRFSKLDRLEGDDASIDFDLRL